MSFSNKNIRIKDLSDNEKPMERMFNLGAGALSDTELLSILIKTGGKNGSAYDLARKMLIEFNGLEGIYDASLEQLQNVKDIGFSKACTIKAACEFSLRIKSYKNGAEVKLIKTPSDVFELTKKDFFGKKREFLFVICLDVHNKFVGKDLVSVGTVNETLIHPREIYRQALKRNAFSIILVHNHPSGDCNPSKQDILITEQIAQAGKVLGIPLLDHIVVSSRSFCSLKSLGIYTTSNYKKGGENA